MFQILTFDDDTLPKIRRAVMLTATLLVLICVGHLRLDLTKGPLTVRLPEGFAANAFDPAVILAPVLIYMLVRMGVTAWWYLKLAKIETVKEDGDFKSLAAALRAYQTEAAARTAYVMPMAQAHIERVEDMHGQLKRLSPDLQSGALDRLVEAARVLLSEPNTSDAIIQPKDIRPASLRVAMLQGSETVFAINDSLRKVQTKLGLVAENADNYRSAIEEALDIAKTFNTEVKEHTNVRHVTDIAKALDVVSTDLIVGAKRKYLIERLFGFALPLLWGGFALWLARASLLDLGQFLRALIF